MSFSFSLSVSLSVWAVSSSSDILTCSVTLDLLGGGEVEQQREVTVEELGRGILPKSIFSVCVLASQYMTH